jgi:V8-like Glu-specific endopeptidase
MACSCPQCTGQGTAGETYETSFSAAAPRRRRPATMGRHATLGAGRSVPGSVAELEGPTGGFHRSLGRARRAAPAPTGELELIGVDERQRVTNTAEVPFRWICAIDMVYPDPDIPGGELHFPPASGTLISPRHVLTAGHVLYDDVTGSQNRNTRRLQVKRVVVTPGRNVNDAPFGASTSSNVIYTDGWRDRLDFRFDYGLITLPDALGDRHWPILGGPLGYWGSPTRGSGTQIVPMSRSGLLNQPASISGYPADQPGGTPLGIQWRASGRVTSTNPHAASQLIYYSVDTCAGHSGSPIWTGTGYTRNMVAIHTGPCIDGPDCTPQPGPICFPDGQQVTHNRGIFITSDVMSQVAQWMGGSSSGLPAPGPRPIVRYGSRGTTVQELQIRLNLWIARTPGPGLAPLDTDGIFGAKTLAAVRAFQRSRGLQVDGIVGPQTWGALFTV